jgi:hypothetical protein
MSSIETISNRLAQKHEAKKLMREEKKSQVVKKRVNLVEESKK